MGNRRRGLCARSGVWCWARFSWRRWERPRQSPRRKFLARRRSDAAARQFRGLCRHGMARPRGGRLPAGRFPRRLPGRRHVPSLRVSTMRPTTSTPTSRSSRARRTSSIASRLPRRARSIPTSSAASACTIKAYRRRCGGRRIRTPTSASMGEPASISTSVSRLFVEGRFHNVFSALIPTMTPLRASFRSRSGSGSAAAAPAPDPCLTLRSGAPGTVRRFCLDRRPT